MVAGRRYTKLHRTIVPNYILNTRIILQFLISSLHEKCSIKRRFYLILKYFILKEIIDNTFVFYYFGRKSEKHFTYVIQSIVAIS